MSASAAVVAEPIPAAAYMTAPAPQQVTYVTSQPAQVMSMPQQVYAQSQPEVVYMTPDGQTVMMAESQMMGGSAAAPMTYEYAAAPAPMYAAPTVYNIAPERFAQIAAGIPLTQEEIDAIAGGGMVQAAPMAMAEPGMPMAPAEAVAGAAPAAPAATGSAKADKKSKKKSSSKSLKASSKKKKAGCC